jgi:hypothetical protein
LSRASHNRHSESRGKKASQTAPSDGNGQSAAALPSPSSDPAAFDAAIDAFVSGARRDFAQAKAGSGELGKGAYHPATQSFPWRILALGAILGLAAGLIAALAIR